MSAEMASDRKKAPKTEAIVVTPIPLHADIAEFVKAGIAGFIPQNATLEDFLRTIRSVTHGIEDLPPRLMGSLLSLVVEHAIQNGNTDQIVKSLRMTKREQDVIDQIAQGRCNKEIAAQLSIAVPAVKTCVHIILGKLALHARLELAHQTRKSNERRDSA